MPEHATDYQTEFDHLIEHLPPESDRKFETYIASYALAKKDNELSMFKDFLFSKLDEEEEVFPAYVAFISLATIYRRNEENARLDLLFKEHGDNFKKQPLYFHFRSLKQKNLGNYIEAIADSRRALKNPALARHAGVLHCYADIIISAFENNVPFPNEKDKSALLEDGYSKLLIAMEEHSYAKFYATKARFLIYKKQFTAAKNALKQAIDDEETGHDYQLRIAKYYQQLSVVQVKEELKSSQDMQDTFQKEINQNIEAFNQDIDEKMNQQQEEYQHNKEKTEEMVEEMKRQNLQMLGFFTAIVSFTIGSLQVIITQSFPNAVLLMLVLAGTLLIAYAGFSYAIFFKANAKHAIPNIVIMSIGAVIIILSILAYQLQWIGEVI